MNFFGLIFPYFFYIELLRITHSKKSESIGDLVSCFNNCFNNYAEVLSADEESNLSSHYGMQLSKDECHLDDIAESHLSKTVEKQNSAFSNFNLSEMLLNVVSHDSNSVNDPDTGFFELYELKNKSIRKMLESAGNSYQINSLLLISNISDENIKSSKKMKCSKLGNFLFRKSEYQNINLDFENYFEFRHQKLLRFFKSKTFDEKNSALYRLN